MSRASEIDPLLPQTETAPEISGGTRGRSSPLAPRRKRTADFVEIDDHVTENQARASEQQTAAPSGYGTLVTILTFVVLFGFVFFLFRPRGLQGPLPSPIHPRPVPPSPARTIEERVSKILIDTPLIDGHNDLAIFIRALYHNDIQDKKFKTKFEQGGMEMQVDLPRLRKGMVGGAFWSTFVVCPEHASTNFSDQEYATAVSETLQQIDLMKRLQARYQGSFTPAGTDLDTMLSQFHGARSMLGPLSLEGLHQIPQSAPMSTLRLFYALGIRLATLTWNCHNAFADAAIISTRNESRVAPYFRGGVTRLGRDVLKEMNRLGMLIDISHTSYWTQKAVLSNNTSRAPVVFSHSSAYTLCPHPRNVRDDILHLVKKTDSIVMVNFSPDFISCTDEGEEFPEFHKKNNTLHQVVRHIIYIGDKIGYDHVGLGSDFDGIGALTPKGLEGVDKYPDLIGALLRSNVSDEDAAKIVGGNILRVWRKAEEVARDMKIEGVPEGQDKVDGFYEEIVRG